MQLRLPSSPHAGPARNSVPTGKGSNHEVHSYSHHDPGVGFDHLAGEKVEKLETLHQDYAKALEKKDLQAIPTLDNRFLDILGPAPEDSLKEPAPDKAKAPREKPQPDAKVADKLDVVGDAKALEQDKMSLDTIRSTYSALAGKTEGDVLKQKMNLVESALKLCRAQAAGHAVGGAEGHPKP